MTNNAVKWGTPPDWIPRVAGDIHLWMAKLRDEGGRKAELRRILAREEIERADRFRFEVHRDRFILRRGLLRIVLGRYLGLEPSRIVFRASEYGKPEIETVSNPEDLRFNSSHSHDRALFAIALGREVGIDIERVVPERADRGVAERFFAPGEVETLRGLTGRDRIEGFFNCWTRKEAYVKARGEGLSFPLDAFEVSVVPGRPAELLGAPRTGPGRPGWTMMDLRPSPGYAAALVTEGPIPALRCWLTPS